MEKGRKNAYLLILRDTCNEDLFLEINFLKAVLRDLFANISSTITENDVLRFPEENLRVEAHRRPSLYTTGC